MGITHPSSSYTMFFQEEVGTVSSFFVRRTYGAKAKGFDQVRTTQSFPLYKSQVEPLWLPPFYFVVLPSYFFKIGRTLKETYASFKKLEQNGDIHEDDCVLRFARYRKE